MKKRILSTLLLLTGFVSVSSAVTSVPPSINNQSTRQVNATMNIDSATVNGQLAVQKIKLPNGTFIDSTTVLGAGGGGSGPFNSSGVSTITVHTQKGIDTSTITTTGNATVGGVLIAGSGSNQVTTSAGLLDATKLTGVVPNGSFPATLPASSGVNLTSLNATNLGSGTVPDARFPATLPAASGANLTALNATNLASGIVPDARFPATLPVASGTNLTALNASNLASGTVPDARFPGTLPAVSGAALTGLNAANLASGTVPDGRFPATLPAASGVNLTALNATNLGSGTVPDARFPATLPSASGANLTSLNASNLGTGTVPDARFPATLPAASGVNLTALNAANLGSGTVPAARLPAFGGVITTVAGTTTTAMNFHVSPSTGMDAGTLASNVVVSSVGVGVVGDAQISGVASSKITGSISIANGGTGQSTYTDGQLLIGNSSGGGLTKATITAGSNVTITNGNGSITINASTSSAGPFSSGKSSTSISLEGFAINNVSTNSWSFVTIAGSSTTWDAPPTGTSIPSIPIFTGSHVSFSSALTGVVTNTSSNTKSGYLIMQSSFAVPSGATPPVDSIGKIGLDTTDGTLITHNGTEQFVVGVATQCFAVYIASGTTWDSLTLPIGSPSVLPYHVRSIRSTVLGGTSLAFDLDVRAFGSLNSAGSNLTASSISASQSGVINSALTNTAVPAFGSIVFKTSSSAASGGVNGVFIRVYYTEDVQ